MKSSYKKLYLLVLTFIVPMVASTLLFYYHDHFHFHTTNQGHLIQPALPFSAWAEPAAQPKQWQIIYLPKNCCDAVCEKNMFTLHQVRTALGKDRNRVSLSLAMRSNCQLKDAHDFRRVSWQQEQEQPLTAALNTTPLDKIYLLDPIGNLFMFYSVNDNAMNILKDMKHILGVSQIG